MLFIIVSFHHQSEVIFYGTISGKQSRVRGGIFTHPSLGTVLESLPSHGSSHLLFVNFIIITKVASFIVSSSICRVGL